MLKLVRIFLLSALSIAPNAMVQASDAPVAIALDGIYVQEMVADARHRVAVEAIAGCHAGAGAARGALSGPGRVGGVAPHLGGGKRRLDRGMARSRG